MRRRVRYARTRLTRGGRERPSAPYARQGVRGSGVDPARRVDRDTASGAVAAAEPFSAPVMMGVGGDDAGGLVDQHPQFVAHEVEVRRVQAAPPARVTPYLAG